MQFITYSIWNTLSLKVKQSQMQKHVNAAI